jgi:cysteine desulfurase/selenocysteine lyase
MLCAETGARLRVAPVDDSGQVLLDEYEKLLGPKTRLVSIAHVSIALGTIVPVNAMVEAAHRHGARVLVDGAQAVSHMRVDVQAINCDFYVFRDTRYLRQLASASSLASPKCWITCLRGKAAAT